MAACITIIIFVFQLLFKITKSLETNFSLNININAKFQAIYSKLESSHFLKVDSLQLCSVISVCTRSNCDSFTFTMKHLSTTFLVYNFTSETTAILKASSQMKYSIPCSVVIYEDANFVYTITYDWIYQVPGSFYNSAHIFILKVPPDLNSTSTGFRLIFNQILVLPSESDIMSISCDSIFTTDMSGRDFLPMGHLCNKGKEWVIVDDDSSNKFLFNKWIDFKGAPYSFAMSALIPIGPQQPDLDKYRNNRSLRINMAHLDGISKGNIEISITLVELADTINATATRKSFLTVVFVKAKVQGKDEFEGLAYEISLGHAHACFGLSNDLDTSNLLIMSEMAGYDSFSFFTGLPVKYEGSLWFLFEAYEISVWIVYSCITSTLVSLLMVINRSFDVRSIYAVMKPVVEQSVESSVTKDILSDYKAKILLFMPLLSSVVSVSLFKSNLASLLVQPSYVYPPRTIEELAESDYKIGTFMSQSTELGEILRDLNETSLIKKMNDRFHHYDLETGEACFINVVKGPYVCFGLKSLGEGAAEMLLRNQKTGHEPFIWAKDHLMSRYMVLGMSKLMPHVKDKMDQKIKVFKENGLTKFWHGLAGSHKIKWNFEDHSAFEAIGIKFPIYFLLMGLAGSLVAFLFEVLQAFFRRRQSLVHNFPEDDIPNMLFIF